MNVPIEQLGTGLNLNKKTLTRNIYWLAQKPSLTFTIHHLEVIYHTRKTVFDHISKHWEES